MKKILFLILLSLPLLFLWGCSLISNNDSWINNWELEKISELTQQLSWLIEQISWLQTENESLKETLFWSLISIQTLQSENETLQDDIDRYKKPIVEDKLNNQNTTTTTQNNTTVANNVSSNNANASNTNSKEIWLIKQVYIDQSWIRKMEIDYAQLGWSDQCNWWVICVINQNPQLRTFTISNNVEIIMQTLSHTSDGSFNNNQNISFDYFRQKFNDTTQYNYSPHNYSNYMKAIPYRITIENNTITKIEEQYMS